MSKCNGKCDGCGEKENNSGEYVQKHFPFRQEIDVEYFLKPLSKQQQDDTPLDNPCKCNWGKGDTKRYMCLPCIKTWVEAVSFDEAMNEVSRLKDIGKNIAAERVEETANQKQWNQPIKKEEDNVCCSSNDACDDCNCKSDLDDPS